MNFKMASLIVALMLLAAYAQGVEEQTYKAFTPLQALIKALVKVGWDLTKLFLGMDESQIAYFSSQLGIREVTMEVNTTDGGTTKLRNCTISSFIFDKNGYLTCRTIEGKIYNITSEGENITKEMIAESLGIPKEEVEMSAAFKYLVIFNLGKIHIQDSAKAQVMLFAIFLPVAIFTFILVDFFITTGILRYSTSVILGVGISLIAMRSGVYTGLLQMIGQLFGPGGFFLSMLSVYLLIAILLWFYGGILKSKRIAEASEAVADAVIKGFAADLKRGLMMKAAEDELREERERRR